MLRMVHISDTHDSHTAIQIPEGDVLIHTGDISNYGNENEIERFFNWFTMQPHTFKILVAGNHDTGLDRVKYAGVRPFWVHNLIAKFTKNDYLNFFLEHDYVKFWGIKIFGSPHTPKPLEGPMPHWGFGYNRSDASKYWVDIPRDVDILLTHAAPYGKCDNSDSEGHIGCESLRWFTKLAKPKIHMFGHVHEDYGMTFDEHTLYVNSSIINPNGTRKHNTGHVIDFNEDKKTFDVVNLN